MIKINVLPIVIISIVRICLNVWFDRVMLNVLCREPVKSYLNDSTYHKIIVLKDQSQNMVLIQTNTGYR